MKHEASLRARASRSVLAVVLGSALLGAAMFPISDAHAEAARPTQTAQRSHRRHHRKRVAVTAREGAAGTARTNAAPEAASITPAEAAPIGSASTATLAPLPPVSQGAADSAVVPALEVAAPLVDVEVDAPEFENGEVPNAPAALQRVRRYVAQCFASSVRGRAGASRTPLASTLEPTRALATDAVAPARDREATASVDTVNPARTEKPARAPASHSQRSAATTAGVNERTARDAARAGLTTLHVDFLVRAPGRAEGVDVAQSSAVSSELRRCVTTQLNGRSIGTPTTDAVGVSVTFRVRRLQGS